MIGKTIGKYRILDKLGRGGMGTVYKAVDETLDRPVAVKVLNPELTDESVISRFRAEATTLARLNHPQIATIYEIYRSDSDLLMVMELVRGETLDELLRRCGPLPPERAAYLVAEVLGALDHAHRAGIVHRDLKPANVMVTEHGGVKVMDFGIARVAGAEHLTTDGTMMGTPAYMAPEQVTARDVDGRADLYSAGVVFYRLLTGNLPFQADTAIAMVQKQLSEQPTPVHMHRGDLPVWCGDILVRALAKSPADRFQTAGEFRDALLGAISHASEHTGAWAAARRRPDSPSAGMPTPPPVEVKADPTPSRNSIPPVAVSATPLPQSAAAMPHTIPAEPATIVIQKNHFAIAAALLAVVAVGVAVLAYVALRRPASAIHVESPVSGADAVAADPSASKNSDSVVHSEPPAATTAQSEPGQPADPVSTEVIASKPNAASDPVEHHDVAESRPVSKAVREPATVTASMPKAAGDSSRKTATTVVQPPFAFSAKTVVSDGGKNREHDTKVLLADGTMTITEKDNRLVAAVPIGTVVGFTFSSSKQPMWNSPAGPAEVLHVDGGGFGFLKGDRNWVSLRTKDRSIVLRLADEDAHRVVAAIEERSGLKVEPVGNRKQR